MRLKTALYAYQEEAADKLNRLKVGALYMEMGTGKTRVALELIHRRLSRDVIDQALWLCPCSVKYDLLFNIQSHAETGKIFICGLESLSQSERIYHKLMKLVQARRTMLIIDESTLVKNYRARRTERAIALAELCPYRLLLNGTPISRNEADLFAQWYILDKRILGYNSYWSFAANHIETDEYGKFARCFNTDYLSRKIAPYSYTCRKADCLDLPGKKHEETYFDLTNAQSRHYAEVKDSLLDKIDEFDSTTIYRLFSGLQLVCSGRRVLQTDMPMRSEPFFLVPEDNPRIKKLLDVVSSLKSDKAIIWCKFRHEIADVAEALGRRCPDAGIVEFHGGIAQKARFVALERFKGPARFMIANKVCGGFGLNLQFAHQMIYYSNDFNWATRAQSEDRLHRIGQTKEVRIIDITASSKVDERILSNLSRKESLSDSFKENLRKGRAGLSAWLDGLEDKDDKARTERPAKTKRDTKLCCRA